MYSQLKVHVPERYHEKIKAAVTKDYPVSIKIDLTKDGEQVVLLTPGQLLKIFPPGCLLGPESLLDMSKYKPMVQSHSFLCRFFFNHLW